MYIKLKEYPKTIERLVPNNLTEFELGALREHIARYNFILKYVYKKNVLDAACGTGYGSSLMSLVASSITGYDVSDEAIEYATSLAYYCPDLFEKRTLGKDLPDTMFDVVVSFETLEHIPDLDGFLGWIKDHCEMFIFSVPNKMYDREDNHYHIHTFSFDEIRSKIQGYFKNISWAGQSLNGLDFKKIDDEKEVKFFIGIATNT